MRAAGFEVLAFFVVAVCVVGAGAREARAQGCALRGTPVMDKGLVVYSAAKDGEVIARFSGQPIAAQATLPAAAGARAALRTGSGDGGLRIEGFVEPKDLPVYSARNLPVVADHVWIGGARRVAIVGTAAGSATVELRVTSPIDQTVRATTPCDGLSLDLPSFTPAPVPGNARGWLAKRAPLELRKAPGGPAVFTLSSGGIKDALLFWSVERKNGFVHVQLTSDLVLDGWLPAGELEALKEGEMMDALATGTPRVLSPKLMVQGEPRRVKVSREVPVRAHADDKAAPIGAIEANGEVLVLETVVGWSNILPAALNVLPPEGQKGGFWVKTADLK